MKEYLVQVGCVRNPDELRRYEIQAASPVEAINRALAASYELDEPLSAALQDLEMQGLSVDVTKV